MVFKKKKTFRKNGNGKSAMAIAKKAYKIARTLKSDDELKIADQTYYTTGLTTSWATSLLTAIQQGVDNTERIGDAVTIKRLNMRLLVTMPSQSFSLSSNFLDAVFRIVVAVDLQQVDSTDMPPAVLFTQVGNGVGPSTVVDTYFYEKWQKRFKILHDKTYHMPLTAMLNSASNVSYTAQNSKYLELNIRPPKSVSTVRWSDPSSANVCKNGICMYYIATQPLNIKQNTQVEFYDA